MSINNQTFIIGPRFPLRETEEGKLEVYGVADTTKVVDQNIKMVLLTRNGEWIGRPGFGVGLHNYLFEDFRNIRDGAILTSNTNEFTEEGGTSRVLPPLRENILSQLRTYVPYITITELDINQSVRENYLNVRIKYFVRDTNLASEFDLTIDEVDLP